MRITACCALLVVLCNLALAAPPARSATNKESALKRQLKWQVANAVLPPKASRTPANMKRPALTAAAWQLSKMLGPGINAGINAGIDVTVRDFERTRRGGGPSLLTPVSIAFTNCLVASVLASMIAKELSQPLAKRASQLAAATPSGVRAAAAGLGRAADTLVLEADQSLRRLVRGR